VNTTDSVKELQLLQSEDESRFLTKPDFFHIGILSVIILATGIYLIAKTTLIAQDGVIYIQLAKDFAENRAAALRNPLMGYPFLIYLTHKITGLFYDATSLQSWIICGQAVSLLSRLTASIVLYFVGRFFIGRRASFWGVLILSILPDCVAFGSDVLGNWPCMMFLSTGFLLLLLGVKDAKYRMLILAGIMTGFGFIIRSESIQVIFYGSLWMALNLFKPQGNLNRKKVAVALVSLLAGFAVISVPYMISKGFVFPRHHLWKLPEMVTISNNSAGLGLYANIFHGGLFSEKIMGDKTLLKNICETLVFYFFPPLLAGCYYYFYMFKKRPEQTFFAAAFIALNVAIGIWQSAYLGYLSRRHTLPLVAFTVFYIPTGLYLISRWISKSIKRGEPASKDIRTFFVILMTIGICLCLVKLVKTASQEKQGYRQTSEWLNKNTAASDMIAVPDKRITFYAQRQGVEYSRTISKKTRYNYIVEIVGGTRKAEPDSNIEEKYSTPMSNKDESVRLVTYKVTNKAP
jgi:hypothetical protein